MHTFIGTRQDDGTHLYSVGSWTPAAYQDRAPCWNPMRDCGSSAEAAMWVNYLNGGAWIVNDVERKCVLSDWDCDTGERSL